MRVIKDRNEFGLRFFVIDIDTQLIIELGGNGDLYWSFFTQKKEPDKISIVITKENYQLYSLFADLYNDIKGINIFDDVKVNGNKYRIYNEANYRKLFNDEKNTITWYSEDTTPKDADYLTIIKNDNYFIVSSHIQEHMKEKGTNSSVIRFTNPGSRYYPFNIVFMKTYNKLKEVDDVSEYGHQIHMEEYLHEKCKTKGKHM